MKLERWLNERRTGLAVSWKSIVLISLHLFALNGVFVFRFPTMQESIERREPGPRERSAAVRQIT